jgi:hypothetical protein
MVEDMCDYQKTRIKHTEILHKNSLPKAALYFNGQRNKTFPLADIKRLILDDVTDFISLKIHVVVQ